MWNILSLFFVTVCLESSCQFSVGAYLSVSLSFDFSTSIHILLFNNPPSCASNYSRFQCVAMPISSALLCVCVCQVGWYWYTVCSAAPRCSPHTGWVIHSQQRQGFPSLWGRRGKRCSDSCLSQYYTFISILLSHVHSATSQSHCCRPWPLLNAEGMIIWRSWCSVCGGNTLHSCLIRWGTALFCSLI